MCKEYARDYGCTEHFEGTGKTGEATATGDDVIEHDAAATFEGGAVEVNDVGVFDALCRSALMDGQPLTADANGAESVDAAAYHADLLTKCLVSADGLFCAACRDADESEVVTICTKRLSEIRCNESCYDATTAACLEVPNKVSHCPLILVCLETGREVLIKSLSFHIVFFLFHPGRRCEAFLKFVLGFLCDVFFISPYWSMFCLFT